MSETLVAPHVPSDFVLTNAINLYAISVAALFCICVLVCHINLFANAAIAVHRALRRYFLQITLIKRHRWIGPLHMTSVVVGSIYIAVNVFCVTFGIKSTADAATRAGELAIINLFFPFGGMHLAFFADILGLSLGTTKSVHWLTGIVCFLLSSLHACIILNKQSFSLGVSSNLYGLLAMSSLALLVTAFNRLLRPLLYELLLRLHQSLALFSAYAIYIHVSSSSQWYILIVVLVCGCITSSETLIFLYRNGFLRYHMPRVAISHEDQAFVINLILHKPIKTSPGQYLNLWIPRAGVFESHPFVIQSWGSGPVKALSMLAVAQSGMTKRLLRLADTRDNQSTYIAMFTGPHGASLELQRYKTVLMFASGSGIAAQLPYIKQLIHDFNNLEARTRRIHLVWIVNRPDIGEAARQSIQEALEEENRDFIFVVSIYWGGIALQERTFGRHAKAYMGLPDINNILIDEDTDNTTKALIVTVSGSIELRDEVHRSVKRRRHRQIPLKELEYQPLND